MRFWKNKRVLGTGVGTSIRELTASITQVTDYTGTIRWNTSKPDGQMKKNLEVSKMRRVLNGQPSTSLRAGLEKTIARYVAKKRKRISDREPG